MKPSWSNGSDRRTSGGGVIGGSTVVQRHRRVRQASAGCWDYRCTSERTLSSTASCHESQFLPTAHRDRLRSASCRHRYDRCNSSAHLQPFGVVTPCL